MIEVKAGNPATIKLKALTSITVSSGNNSVSLYFEDALITSGHTGIKTYGPFKMPGKFKVDAATGSAFYEVKTARNTVNTPSGVLGPVDSLDVLNTAFPAENHAGKEALLGSTAPYSRYVSNGVSWEDSLANTLKTKPGQTVLDDASRALLCANGYSGWGKHIRVITMGDSITQYGSASGWMLYVEMVSNGRVKLVRDAAIAGNRTDQMVARFATDVAPYASQADELWIMTGANDATAGDTSTVFASDLTQLIDLGLSAGLRVRVFAMPPNDTSISNALKFREITGAVSIKKGVDFCDPWQTCINPATGGFLAADTIDGVHPSAAGHTKAGQAVVTALNIPTSHNIALPVQNAANGGMMSNPLFVTDSNADGLADGWGSSGSGVASLVASTFGNKQRFTATALTGPTYIQNNPILTVVPGNVYSVKGKLTVSGTDHNWYLRIRWQTAASIDTENLYPWNGQANATGEFEFRVTAPADATKLAVQFSLLKQAAKSSYNAVLDIEQFQIVNLTAIGLA